MKLTPEQLAQLIQKVMANLAASKETVGSFSVEDILAEISVQLDEMTADDSEPVDGEEDTKADEPAKETPDVSPELVEAVLAAINGAKAAEPAVETPASELPSQVEVHAETKALQRTAPQPQMQRKYANIFLAPGATAAHPNSFKSSIDSLTVP